MNVQKGNWTADEHNVRLAMPLTKVDTKRRLVSGFASLDNADSHDDIVLAEASVKAFTRFRGNIREMHQPIAVGKMVDFKEDEYYDSKDGKFYRGVYVTVYVSTGAEDTWQKVLDGTLTGFSIGGSIIDADTEFSKDAGKPIRFIKDYELNELSLVDNPANQMANIMSVEKVNGVPVMKGSVADVSTATAFYCPTDDLAKVSTNESEVCAVCEKPMVDIGWFEYASSEERSAKTGEAVQKYLASNNTQEEPATNEGGVDVADKTVEKSEEGVRPSEQVIEVGEQGKAQTEIDSSVESDATDVAAEAEVSDDEAGEDAAAAPEVADAEDDLAKMLEGFRDEIKKAVDDNLGDVSVSIDNIKKAFDEFSKVTDSKIEQLAKEHGELTKKIANVEENVGKMEKSVSALEGDSAVKKSNDLGGSEAQPVIRKGNGFGWGGHFLDINSSSE